MAFSITLDFRLFHETSLHDIYDEIGVYVFWNSSAMTIPSYIGEGEVLTRFTDHLGKTWARRPLDGFVAVIRDGTPTERKWRAEFGEMALFDVCRDLFGQLPTHNRQDGKERGLNSLRRRLGPSHKKFTLRVEGRDPFVHPFRSKSIRKFVSYEDDGGYVFDHSWSHRSRR